MADESEGIDIKLSEEDSPADILRESEDISLFADDDGSGEASNTADLKLDDDLSDSEEDDLKLGMDEIGDLVDEIKLDDQEEEKADAPEDGEEDMVFEETKSQLDGSLELDSALNELGEDEIDEKSIDDASAGEWCGPPRSWVGHWTDTGRTNIKNLERPYTKSPFGAITKSI